ncbi:hypothetical protein CQA40_08775 [Helicobacter sp. MIT 01-3238]|nr:hypothetical protein CQA40_08775 [Helicobacter sp. MIT 01-3238]
MIGLLVTVLITIALAFSTIFVIKVIN